MLSKIKEIKIYKADVILKSASADELEEVQKLYAEVSYNEAGKITKDVKYMADTAVEQVLEYRYDDKNRLIEEIMYEDENTVLEKKTYDYNDNNKITKEHLHYLDDSFDTVFYSYNNNEELVNKKKVDSDGELEETTDYEYSDDRCVSIIEKDADQNIINEKRFVFNAKGLLIEESEYDGYEDTLTKKTHEYNDDGAKTATYIYNNAGKLVEKFLYTEDEIGQLSKIIEENTLGLNTIEMAYDKNGNVILTKEHNDNGDIVSEIKKAYNDENLLQEAIVASNKPIPGGNYKYTLKYEYTYFE